MTPLAKHNCLCSLNNHRRIAKIEMHFCFDVSYVTGNTAQQYIGCFRDDASRVALDLPYQTHGLSINDIEVCMHICDGTYKTTYLGLQVYK